LKPLYLPVKDKVGFYAVDIDPSETIDMVRQYPITTGYSWTYALGNVGMLQTLNVTSTDIKYVVDQNGVITYTAGYGVADVATWTNVLQALVST
jgi:hypothetical protein